MESVLLASIGTLAAASAGAAYWLASRRRAPRSDPQPTPRLGAPVTQRSSAPPAPRAKLGGRFSAVQIRPRSGACRAAQLLQGHPFLAKDAPALPLPECNAARCSCTFSKLPDRRSDGRRLEHGGLSASLFLATNRRTKRDRRRAAHASPRT
jgi:hypothetical protein